MASADPDADVPGMLAPQRVAIGIVGPIVIAWSLQIFLTGIAVSAFWASIRRGRISRDSTALKFLVITVFLFNLEVAFSSGASIFHFATTQMRTTAGLFSQTPMQCLQPAMIGTVGALVQSWFARRTSMLFVTRRSGIIYLSVIGFGIVAAFGSSIAAACANYAYIDGVPGDYVNALYTSSQATWLFVSAVVTAANSATLCYLLKKRVRGFSVQTDSVLDATIKLALETGSYVAFVATLGAILSVALDLNSYYVGDVNFICWVPLSSLYTISLFSTLDSRDQLAQGILGDPRTGGILDTKRRRPSRGITFQHQPSQLGQITVDVEVHEEYDTHGEAEKETQKRRGSGLRRKSEVVDMSGMGDVREVDGEKVELP